MSDVEPVTVMCAECGAIMEIKDIRSFILSLHQANECDVSTLITHGGTA